MSNKTDPAAAEPLYGFMPRHVKGKQVRKALVCLSRPPTTQSLTHNQDHNLNPFTKKPHTAQYRTILEARKKLPVFGQMDEFLEIVRPTVIFDMRRGLSSALYRNLPPSSSQSLPVPP
jgi:pre-mRNA-splicing factor ATP-dependent RNA helicase DHX15/PRP43